MSDTSRRHSLPPEHPPRFIVILRPPGANDVHRFRGGHGGRVGLEGSSGDLGECRLLGHISPPIAFRLTHPSRLLFPSFVTFVSYHGHRFVVRRHPVLNYRLILSHPASHYPIAACIVLLFLTPCHPFLMNHVILSFWPMTSFPFIHLVRDTIFPAATSRRSLDMYIYFIVHKSILFYNY